jgi:hypothetical protein
MDTLGVSSPNALELRPVHTLSWMEKSVSMHPTGSARPEQPHLLPLDAHPPAVLETATFAVG